MPRNNAHPYFAEPVRKEKEFHSTTSEGASVCRILSDDGSAVREYELHASLSLIELRHKDTPREHLNLYAAYFVTQMLLSMKGELLLEKVFPERSLVGYLGFWHFNNEVVEIKDEIEFCPDFGFPRFLLGSDIEQQLAVTRGWAMSPMNLEYKTPEKLLESDRKELRGTISSDLYALGMLVHNLFYAKQSGRVNGKDPYHVLLAQLEFSNPSTNEIDSFVSEIVGEKARMFQVVLKKRCLDSTMCGVSAHFDGGVPESAKELIESMTSFFPAGRKSVDELLRMPFFDETLLSDMLLLLIMRLDIDDAFMAVAPLVAPKLVLNRDDSESVRRVISHMISQLKAGRDDWFDIMHIAVLKKYAAEEYKQTIKAIRDAVLPLAIKSGLELPGKVIAGIIGSIPPHPLPERFVSEMALRLFHGMRKSAKRITENRLTQGFFSTDAPPSDDASHLEPAQNTQTP